MAGHRPWSPADRAAADAARQATLDQLHTQLTDGILALHDPTAWQNWLQVASRFPRYSFRNQILILRQDPHATAVCGYRAFQAMGRQVRRGEKAIKVLAPITKRVPREDAHGHPILDDQGRPTYRTVMTGTKAVSVFDVRQTDGPPLPPPPKIGDVTLLTGQAPPGLWDNLQTFIEGQGFTVSRAPCGDANGTTDFAARQVTVRPDLDDAQAVKTLSHEAGHVLLHADRAATGERGLKEVEAESVAYLVTAAHGLDSAQYTFSYVAGWALQAVTADHGLDDVLRSTAQRVLDAAATILKATQPAPEPTVTDEALDVLDLKVRAQLHPSAVERISARTPAAASPAPVADSPQLGTHPRPRGVSR